MLKRLKRKLITTFFGLDSLLSYVGTRQKFLNGHSIKAALFALYTYPLRKFHAVENPFINAPREYYSEIHELLHISKVKGFELLRVGHDNDGGYIMVDDFASDDKTAYSFGISDDVSWDKDMASRGYDVFMYDHTIDGLPEENPRFHWSKLGIADGSTQDSRLKTLDELIKQNHHEDKHNMILKMDVEGAEWGFIENTSSETLSRFSQIMLEFHGIHNPKYMGKIPAALRKLNKTHKPVHIHGQNIGHYVSVGTQTFCRQIEVSYVRRDKYDLDDDYDVLLPLSIDMPALKNFPEIYLGHWNRKITPDDNFTSITVVLTVLSSPK